MVLSARLHYYYYFFDIIAINFGDLYRVGHLLLDEYSVCNATVFSWEWIIFHHRRCTASPTRSVSVPSKSKSPSFPVHNHLGGFEARIWVWSWILCFSLLGGCVLIWDQCWGCWCCCENKWKIDSEFGFAKLDFGWKRNLWIEGFWKFMKILACVHGTWLSHPICNKIDLEWIHH